MTRKSLTDDEQALFDILPGPPVEAIIKSTNVWIIEWLPSGEHQTGKLLHEWMQRHRHGWSAFFECKNKSEVLFSIERAIDVARNTEMRPVLHIEAHGDTDKNGLIGPDGKRDLELLKWSELTEPLQRLNLVTRCNLVVVVAACIGFAGIKALVQGPRAPAVALVGPDASIMSNNLLSATKEFYHRWMGKDPRLAEIALKTSQVAKEAFFEWEPFAVLAFDAMAELLIVSTRQDQQLIK